MKRCARIRGAAAGLAAALLAAAALTGCGRRDAVPLGARTDAYAAIDAPEPDPPLPPVREPDAAGLAEEAFGGRPETPAERFACAPDGDGATVLSLKGGGPVVIVPREIGGRPVTAIAPGAFAGRDDLTAVSLPDSVVSVGAGAFEGCAGLRTLRTPVVGSPDRPFLGALFDASVRDARASAVPASLSSLIVTGGGAIPEGACLGCRRLTRASLEVGAIGAFAFYDCGALQAVDLSRAPLTSVGERAFCRCASLTSLSLPATVAEIGPAALMDCPSLRALSLPFVGGSRAESGSAFLGYLFGAADYVLSEHFVPDALVEATLTEGCPDLLPDNAFFGCSSLRSVSLPRGVRSIGRRAFYGCRSLASIALPDTVTSLGDDAFHGCVRLRSVSGGAGLTGIGIQAFMDCLSLVSITLPASVRSLPNSCFAGCVSLETVTAPGVTSVGDQAFRHCRRLSGWADGPGAG